MRLLQNALLTTPLLTAPLLTAKFSPELQAGDYPLDTWGILGITILGLMVVFLVFLCATLFQSPKE